jgi:prepilin-type N-terminal cleavage/methylation domain-containing protein
MSPSRVSSAATRESGVTLVELLIALALFGFIMLGIAPLFIASVKSNYSANEYTSIHNLARDRLEQLMNLPFNDAQLQPGIYTNDLPPVLPGPLPPTPGTVVNPFTRVYQVRQWQIPSDSIATVPLNAPYTPVLVTAAGQPFDYKRIDVEVRTDEAHLGIGQRRARVTGILQNPNPIPGTGVNLTVADPCGSATPFTCP